MVGRLACVLALSLVASCECAPPFVPLPDACAAVSCADVGAECGEIDDGCGGTLACGECAGPDICGEAGPNVCGAPCASDTDCEAGAWCDALRCTARCRIGSSFAAEVPRVAIDLRFTLRGGHFPTLMAQARAPGPRVLLRELGGAGETEIELYPVASGAGEVARSYAPPGIVQLVPGVYDVVYEAGSPWPEAIAFEAGPVTVPREPATLAIDLAPPAPVLLRATFTLDGGALPGTAPATPLRRVSLLLTGSRGGRYLLYLCVSPDGTAPAACTETHEVRLVPDRYAVLYDFEPAWPTSAQTVWPVGRGSIATLDVTGDAAVTVDIPRAVLTLEATLRSAPLTTITTGVPREAIPRVDLSPADGPGYGPSVPMYAEEAGGAYRPTSESIAVLPGAYLLSLSGSTLPGWPELPGVLPSAEVRGDARVAFDVSPVRLDVTVTANGVVAPEPCFGLVVSPAPYEGSAVVATVASVSSFAVLPGRYALGYIAGAPRCSPSFPGSDAGYLDWLTLAESVDVSGDTTFARDIATVHVTADLTLGGEAIADEPDAVIEPSIELRAGTLGVHGGPGAWLPPFARVGVTSRFELWLPPGSYDARLLPSGDERVAGWPPIGATIAALDLASDGAITIDVPRTRTTMSVTIAGGDGTADATLHLRRDGAEVGIPVSDAAMRLAPASAWLVPGRYEVRYVARPTADGAPGGARDLGCWDVP